MNLIFRCLPEYEPFLLRPLPAAQSLPDWLKQMPSKAASDVLDGLEVRTLKHCAPMLDAMQTGVLFLLPCDVEVRGGEFFWQSGPATICPLTPDALAHRGARSGTGNRHARQGGHGLRGEV